VHERDDPARATEDLGNAKTALHEASASIRRIARELRDSSMEHGGLATAIDDYIAAHVPNEQSASCSVVGDVGTLPVEIGDELYIVIRETVRNAVRHAGAA